MNQSRLCFAEAVLVHAALLATLGGCGSGDLPLAPVQGTVTYQGKPLDHGRVVFIPEKGTPGPQVVGTIGSDGTFRINTLQRDGASLGWHRVTVLCCKPAKSEKQAPTGVSPAALMTAESLIPKRYSVADDSPLEFEVKEGRNEYAIELE